MQDNQLLLKSKEPKLFMAIEQTEPENQAQHEDTMPRFFQ
jgi:hypothetical protein